jgi:hypothetical protein
MSARSRIHFAKRADETTSGSDGRNAHGARRSRLLGEINARAMISSISSARLWREANRSPILHSMAPGPWLMPMCCHSAALASRPRRKRGDVALALLRDPVGISRHHGPSGFDARLAAIGLLDRAERVAERGLGGFAPEAADVFRPIAENRAPRVRASGVDPRARRRGLRAPCGSSRS